MKHRTLLRLLLLPFFGLARPSQGADLHRPNLLFILTEDQGAHLGCLGTPGLQTPNMDALASSGVLFRNAFVAYPVCSASKAAIYTGLHNHTNGILNNTPNYHKPAARLTEAEKNSPLYLRNRIHDSLPTWVERLKSAGYYQGVTHKLHVAPVEKFPYDEFLQRTGRDAMEGFIQRAAQAGKPWHLLYNISVSHRPFPNSDLVKIRVSPDAVRPPAFLPDTPVVRKDWAEYLAALEEADRLVGEALEALHASGQETNTVVVFLGDHGPAFQHGKMTLHDLGLRVPLMIRAPGLKSGVVSDALASELDLAPTLMDLLGLAPLPATHGVSLRPVVAGLPNAKGHDFIFAEISDRGSLPNTGMQERSVCDGRWHLIYREKISPPWRQINADSKEWKTWGNRSYAETVRVKSQCPALFQMLAEMDPQGLGGAVPALELYDLKADPDELHNLAHAGEARPHRDRLYAALRQWISSTADTSVQPPAAPPE
jgi:N-sulfoglucosamine sulfohydrolase